MTQLTVGNAQITYRAEGSGPALVLVHGVGSGAAMWDELLPQLTDRNTVLLPDLSGSDAAEDDGAPLTIETLAEQVIAVIEHAGAGPADVVGFSLGAPTAAAVAALRPDLVRRLLPVAGFVHAEDEYLQQLITAWLALTDNPEGFGRLGTLTSFTPRYLNEIGHDLAEQTRWFMSPVHGRLRQLDLVRRVDVRSLLPRIEAPTLVIGCTRDQLIPVENHREFAGAITGSEYTELDTGHVTMAERPADFLKLVHDFLARP
ncbi:alpha/beta hydrolase [Actinomadura spongiicola]|uniref:Alpha/beta hydrolase n=1 Tax=Actinomadura spongiicola TaxID=2303421 RepID=A0A372GNE1_9ACTN|nr:alpha/beta hydrolase [Actinomadura spongiicola]RFS86920.1 alpha/beta hydrolase [Actinomadura spongiicola]